MMNVGIDVSKLTLDVAILPAQTSFQVPNTKAGWSSLITTLATGTTPCIVMEPTSTYHLGVQLALADAGLPATLVNPRWMRAFAESEGTLAKTDRVDAQVLARFAAQRRPAPTPVPRATLLALRELLGCRDDLVKMLVAEQHRLALATRVTQVIHRRVIRHLERQQQLVEDQMATLIATDPVLTAREAQLRTAPGVGPVTSRTLLTELPELGRLDHKAIASLAGLAPHPRERGKRFGKRTPRGGRRHVTKAMSMAAMTAKVHDPGLTAHYQILCQRHPKKVAIIAIARRLLVLLNAMVRDDLSWQDLRHVHHRADAPAA